MADLSGQVQVFPMEAMVCRQLLSEVIPFDLNTDKNISIIENIGLTEDELALFILHLSSETYTGLFSFYFHNKLREMLDNGEQNKSKLKKFLSDSANLWPEVTQNSHLTSTQIDEINAIYGREKIAILNTIRAGCSAKFPFSKNIMKPCPTKIISQKPNEYSIYSQCLNRVCIEEKRMFPEREITHNDEYVGLVRVKIDENLMLCTDLVNLMERLSDKSNDFFSPQLQTELEEKYSKELSMYNFYHSSQ